MTTPACPSPCQGCPNPGCAGGKSCSLDGRAQPKAAQSSGTAGPGHCPGHSSPSAPQSSQQQHKQATQRALLALSSQCSSTSAFGKGETPCNLSLFPRKHMKTLQSALWSQVQVGMRNRGQTRGTFHHHQAAPVTSAELSLHCCCCSHLSVQPQGGGGCRGGEAAGWGAPGLPGQAEQRVTQPLQVPLRAGQSAPAPHLK